MADVFREKKSQTERDLQQIEMLKEYISASPTSDFNKFDNFTKYVQTSAISRFLARYEVFKLQLNVPGCILDLGVGRGASLMTWAQISSILEPVNYTREIIGFDTFEGCPELDERDTGSYSSLVHKGGFSVEEGMQQDIERAIEIYDVNRPLRHLPKVSVIKGDICETLPEFVKDMPHLVVSLIHFDTDLYCPTKTALEVLKDRLPKGAVLLFDELNNKFYPGETLGVLDTIGVSNLKLCRFPWATTVSYAVLE